MKMFKNVWTDEYGMIHQCSECNQYIFSLLEMQNHQCSNPDPCENQDAESHETVGKQERGKPQTGTTPGINPEFYI